MPSFNSSAPNGASSMNSTTSTNGNTVNGSTSVAPGASFTVKAKQASSAWHNFQNAWKILSEHSPVFLQIAEAMDQHDNMQVMMHDKDEKIAKLESAFQVQMDQHGKCLTIWEQEKSQLEQRGAEIEAKISAQAQSTLKKHKATHMQDVEKLKKELESDKKTVATLKEELGKANTKTARAKEELSHCTKQVSEWEGYLSLLKDIDFKKL